MKFDVKSLEKALIGVPSKASALIAYRCALRVFPLLTANGIFDCWREKKKRYLYSLYMALDISIGINRGIPFADAAFSKADATFAADEAALAADAAAFAADADTAAAFAADAAASRAAAVAALAAAADAALANTAVAGAVARAVARAIAAASNFSDPYKNQLLSSIAADLKMTRNAKNPAILEYAPLWPEKTEIIRTAEKCFKTVLESDDLDFSYWWGIYEQHAEGSVDMEALEQRLTVPEEVKEQGAEFITDYLIKLSGKTSRLNEMRIIFMGDGGSGKTSLIRRLFGEEMSEKEESTTEIKVRDYFFTEADITAHFWDFGGQVMLHATHQLFLRERCIYVVVLDGRKEENPEYWLDHVKMYGNSSPVFIVKNKCDLGGSKDIPVNMLKEKYDNIVGNYSISCENSEMWSKTINVFSQKFSDHITVKSRDNLFNPEIPKSFFEIKTELKNLKNEILDDEVTSVITYDTFRNICRKYGISKEVELQNLMGFFDSLGVMLKFKNHNEHVLNPDWLSVAAYRILRSEKVISNNGTLSLTDLEEILERKKDDFFEYHVTKHKFILEVLNSFELLYFLKYKDVEDSEILALIPDLLPNDQLIDLDQQFKRQRTDLLHFVYDFNFLPSSVMTRFIVKMHGDINLKYLWRHGVILTDGSNSENRALVIEDKKMKRISIWVYGGGARGYFSCIRKLFLEILHTSFTTTYQKRDEYYSEQVPLGKNKNGKDIYISYDELLQKEEDGDESFIQSSIRVPDESNPGRLTAKKFNVKELLNGYSLPEQREEEMAGITNNYYGVDSVDNRVFNANGTGAAFLGDNQSNSLKGTAVNIDNSNNGTQAKTDNET